MGNQIKNHEPSYSQIIDAISYNKMMTSQHLYIAEADEAITNIVRTHVKRRQLPTNILEIGCGPIRLTPSLANIPSTVVTALDHDNGWIQTAKRMLMDKHLLINLVCEDIEHYQQPQSIDIAVSQGSHHHIQKGEHTANYLANVRNQLSEDGIFVLSDEVVPYYDNEEERYIRLCIWYAHIIHHAMQSRYNELATAEMETLLDDLFEGSGQRAVKSDEQMELVEDSIAFIENSMKHGLTNQAESLSSDLVKKIWESQNHSPEQEAPLSRGDYKICFAEFEKEILAAGFRIRDVKTIGPIETIGGFGIYTLDVKP